MVCRIFEANNTGLELGQNVLYQGMGYSFSSTNQDTLIPKHGLQVFTNQSGYTYPKLHHCDPDFYLEHQNKNILFYLFLKFSIFDTKNTPKYRINQPSTDLAWNTGYVPLSQDPQPPQPCLRGYRSWLCGTYPVSHAKSLDN